MAKRQQHRTSHVIDDEPDSTTSYATGPGRRRWSTGAVAELYADDGAIDRHCGKCGAKPLEFCRWPNGTERRMPCGGR